MATNLLLDYIGDGVSPTFSTRYMEITCRIGTDCRAARETVPRAGARSTGDLPRSWRVNDRTETVPERDRARKVSFGVVLTCVGPRPRDHHVGEQEQGVQAHLQLRPHKQPGPNLPALLRLAHPRRTHGGEGDLVFDPLRGSGTSGAASKELGRFFVGRRSSESKLGWRGAGSLRWGGAL